MLDENLKDNNLGQTPEIDDKRTKQETASVIEAMLDEIGMSKDELIELLVGGIKLDLDQSIEVQQGQSNEITIAINALAGLTNEELANLEEQGVDIEALKDGLSKGKNKFSIFEFFTYAKILTLLSRISLAFNLNVLKRLGFELSPTEIERVLNIEHVKSLDIKNLAIQAAAGTRALNAVEIDKLKNYSQDKINTLGQGSGQQTTANSSVKRTIADQANQQMQQTAAVNSGNPTSGGVGAAANIAQQQARQISTMSRGLRWLRDKTSSITDRVKENLAKVERRVEKLNAGFVMAQIEQLNKAVTEFAAHIKDTYPEISAVHFKGNQVHITMSNGGQMNLKDFLDTKGHLSPAMSKLVDDAGNANAELLKALGGLQKKMTQHAQTTFGDDNKLEIRIAGEKEVGKMHLLDYLHDMKKVLDGKGSKHDVNTTLLGDEEKKGDFKGKLEKEAEAGLQKDKKGDNSGSSNQEQEKGMGMPIVLDAVAKGAEKKEVSIDHEVEDLRKDLIKIDAMNDAKKHLKELNEAKNLFSKGMSAMGEAKMNDTKEVMKEMQEKMQANKQMGIS